MISKATIHQILLIAAGVVIGNFAYDLLKTKGIV